MEHLFSHAVRASLTNAQRAWVHTPESLAASTEQADVSLPAAITGNAVFCGKLNAMPPMAAQAKPVPVILLLHGSCGLGLKAIGEWQRWLAGLGVASVAPDSFTLAG